MRAKATIALCGLLTIAPALARADGDPQPGAQEGLPPSTQPPPRYGSPPPPRYIAPPLPSPPVSVDAQPTYRSIVEAESLRIERHGRVLRNAGLVVLPVGLALAVGSLAAWFILLNTDSCAPSTPCQNTVDNDIIVATVGLVFGAVTSVVGGALVGKGLSQIGLGHRMRVGGLTLAPLLAPHSAGARLALSF